AELDRLDLWDRDLLRRHAAERVVNELEAWGGEPVFAYGFEDLTGAEWALLQALAGRSAVTVSMPYEPGRPAFASLGRTMDDLSSLADGRIEELPPRFDEVAAPALAHLERALFTEEETIRLRDGQPLPVLEALRSAPTPLDAVAGLAASMLRAAYGLEAPPVGEVSRHDIRAHDAVMRLLGELRGWSELDGSLSTEE